MGIPGLLPALKDFTHHTAQIRQFHGQSIAVDTSSWLHKAVYSVADAYVISDEASRVDQHCVRVASRYLLQRCQELIVHANVSKIYLVLDGQHRCPLKAVTHKERTRKRALALEQARQAPNKQAAYEKYKACIHISHAFTQAVLAQVRKDQLFRQQRIVLVQSPHEADAQLVQLAQTGHVQAIITEDSDVLVYAATAKSDVTVIYKFNRHTGACQTIRMTWLWDKDDGSGTNDNGDEDRVARKSNHKTGQQQVWRILQSRERAEPGAGRRLFVQACVLTGCDYAPNELPGVGLVKAFALVTSNTHLPADQRFVSVVRGRMPSRSLTAPYIHKLRQAEAVFYYHPVRDPFTKRLAWITVDEPGAPEFPVDNLDILGNPDELRFLAVPGGKTVSNQQDVTKESSLEREETQPAVDDAYLEVVLEAKKPPLPVSLPAPTKPTHRAPTINPYRKRPLVTSQSPNHKTRSTFNPFARFRHATEKENHRYTAAAQVLLAPLLIAAAPPVQPETTSPVSAKKNAPPDDTSASDFLESKISSKVDEVIDSASVLSAKKDDDSSVTDCSESGPPLPEPKAASSPSKADEVTVSDPKTSAKIDTPSDDDSSVTKFSQSGAPLPKPMAEPTPMDDSSAIDFRVPSMPSSQTSFSPTSPYFGKSLPRRVTQEPVASQPAINVTSPASPVAIKPTSAVDFYDEWLSPKQKESAPMDDDEKNKPIAPQGAMRFRLAGIGTSRPLLSSKARPAKNSLTFRKKSLQPKLVYRPPRSKTLLDHFRADKDQSKR
eukprot:scaffold437_cov159-Amphora_coffeaeformis.AAC.18